MIDDQNTLGKRQPIVNRKKFRKLLSVSAMLWPKDHLMLLLASYFSPPFGNID
jgi:hypothetical protein